MSLPDARRDPVSTACAAPGVSSVSGAGGDRRLFLLAVAVSQSKGDSGNNGLMDRWKEDDDDSQTPRPPTCFLWKLTNGSEPVAVSTNEYVPRGNIHSPSCRAMWVLTIWLNQIFIKSNRGIYCNLIINNLKSFICTYFLILLLTYKFIV